MYCSTFAILTYLEIHFSIWLFQSIHSYHSSLISRQGKIIGHITTEEFRQATLRCCKSVQRKEFISDITKLMNNQNLSSKNKLLCLAVFDDQEGTLRFGGRLKCSFFTNDKKHPISLLKQHHITKLIVNYLHVFNLNVGPRTLLTIMR